MKFLFAIISLLATNGILAQSHLIKQWDKRFGGDYTDFLYAFQQTNDGGYILGGSSTSDSSGDKTQPAWSGSIYHEDYWVVKIDSVGNKQWDKRFGGNNSDVLYSLQQTTDGGYILGGESNSGINGDKTQPLYDTTHLGGGTGDYWVVKIDSVGNKQWDKRFGGYGPDGLKSLQQTTDRGYILGGWSKSDIGGDRTQDTWGYEDYWIVKIDSVGNKQWDKRFGGTDIDFFTRLQQTSDGGYILAGATLSDSSGDKTQPKLGISSNLDYWIVKIDSLGTKQWDKRFGGTSTDGLTYILQTSDRGYILGGTSVSGIGGDKTQPLWGNSDYWIIKIDSVGNFEWDKDYGGEWDQSVYSICETVDGGYLFGGISTSDSSGEKSENNLWPSQDQNWIVKTDSHGNKQWDKTIFTRGQESVSFAIQTKDQCYAIATFTDSDTGGYKTQPTWDSNPVNWRGDYWIIKFCDANINNSIKDLSPEIKVSIYPNPFVHDISITLSSENITEATFTIRNILGQNIYYKKETNLDNIYTKSIDLSVLPNGVYFVETIYAGKRMVKKIVKE